MQPNCERCGAPLDVPLDAEVVTCVYCKMANPVRNGQRHHHRPPPVPPPVPQTPFAPPLGTPRVARPQGGNATNVSAAIGLAVVGAMGAFGVLLTKGGSGIFHRRIDYTAAPTVGVVSLAIPPGAAVTRSGNVDGALAATTLRASCRGYVTGAPQFTLAGTTVSQVTLDVHSSTDTTLVVRDSRGMIYCDDDGGDGHDPRVTAALPPGNAQVWVGTYASSQGAAFTFSVQSHALGAMPEADGFARTAGAELGSIALNSASSPMHVATGSTTGSVEGRTLGASCRGYFEAAPQLELSLAVPMAVALTTTTPSSSDDLTMAVVGPDGTVRCDDDSGEGNAPRIEAVLQPGSWKVWVGTYARGTTSDFSLRVASAVPGQVPRLTPTVAGNDLEPSLGVVDLTNGATVTRGGNLTSEVDASSLGSGCRGFIPTAPHLVFSSAVPRSVSIRTTSNTDTTLAVRDSNNVWHCDDDSGGGSNARVDMQLRPGRSSLWVGTYSRGSTGLFSVSISSLGASGNGPSRPARLRAK